MVESNAKVPGDFTFLNDNFKIIFGAFFDLVDHNKQVEASKGGAVAPTDLSQVNRT